MKTDDLINTLSVDFQATPHRPFLNSFVPTMLVVAGGVLAFALVGLGARPDLANSGAIGFLLAKLAFTGAVVLVGSVLLIRLAVPGGEARTSWRVALWPFAAMVVVAAFSVWGAPHKHWQSTVTGGSWPDCIALISVMAIVPFAALVVALRRNAAPTDLPKAGAFVGFVSGGLGAMAYSFHCTDDSMAFVAIWYSVTVGLCTAVGRAFGPRLLRW